MAKITDIASEIYLELSEPSDISIASIAQKLRFTIGDLNNLINQGYTLNSSYEIIDDSGAEIDLDAVSILKKLYIIYYFRKQSQVFLGANGISDVEVIQQDGVVFRGISRNNVAKSYTELYKESKEELKSLLNNFKFNRATGRQITGDDHLGKYDVGE